MNDIVIKAVAVALRNVPEANGNSLEHTYCLPSNTIPLVFFRSNGSVYAVVHRTKIHY